MAETKYVKIVSDGRWYWLLWRWKPITDTRPPDGITVEFAHAGGGYKNLEEARAAIPEDWTEIPLQASD